ncbi:MAG: prephenate dehydrogenase [Methanobacterium sp.]|uniref:prephenate dehydrogenase n=1 Tax=Methanobacterium sp. TaxID=2164 RepID=UPI003D662A89|nr:prephenate dehydrogenase [Methanobacterium sp.]
MKVTVIGGTRGLGKWIAQFLKDKGFSVVITGRDEIAGEKISKKLGVKYTSNNAEAVSNADIVILAVPIDAVSSVIPKIAPFLKRGSLFMDVTSVKEKPAEIMKKHVSEGIEIIPTHPLFGPRIRSLDGQVVVLTPENRGEWYKKVFKFLENENARVLVTTPQNHDKMMSIVQGLTHFAYIGIAATIERLKIDVKESRKFESPIYGLMVDMIARIVAQNPYLYYSIQTQNRYVKETHETFISVYNELNDMILREDEAGFVHVMGTAAKHLDDLEAALGRSDKAISALTEEIRILKNSIGNEVGLKHIYSDNIHVGVLKKVSSDFIVLNENNKKVNLKLSNVEVMDDNELIKWKTENLPRKSYDISAVFPENCDPDIIVETMGNLKDVVDVSIADKYQGNQIAPGNISITFKFEVINPDARFEVENLLKGFGSKIR